jgi:DNA-binding LytR/AlgR family response regulator
MTIKAILADDEPLMLKRLADTVARAWPELQIVASCKNGLEALEAFRTHQPQILFLDIRMPGKTGLEVAAEIGDAAHIVFVTAYDEYAIDAFKQGAADYLLKPVELDRVHETVERLQKRMAAMPRETPADLSAMVAALLARSESSSRVKWIRASVGNITRLIHVDDVLFFQSDMKYTRIVLKGNESEALVRTPLKELLEGLDPEMFWQVHRGTIVNAHAIDRAIREGPEKLTLHLRGSTEKLAVSRQYFHLFKQT